MFQACVDYVGFEKDKPYPLNPNNLSSFFFFFYQTLTRTERISSMFFDLTT